MKTTAVLALAAVAATLGCSKYTPPPSRAQARGGGGVAEMQAAASFHTSVRQAADLNDAFRRVLFTGAKSQIVLMTIPPGTDIGLETYAHVEQVLYVAGGRGKVLVGRTEWPLAEGDLVVVTPGSPHDVINTGVEPLRIVTVDTPPRHMDGVVHSGKEAADTDLADKAFGAAVR